MLSKADHPRMRVFPWQTGWSHLWSAVSENHMLRANFTAISSMDPKLLPIEFLHCGNREFLRFLLLWAWPWQDDLHIRTWTVSPQDMHCIQTKMNFYVNAFESYRITDRHTCRQRDRQTYRWHRKHYHAPSRLVITCLLYTSDAADE